MNEYLDLLYADHAFPEATPSAILGVAALYGATTRPRAGLRVLDLGCAVGGHLLPLAALDPTGTYVGVDLSEPQIAVARARAAAAGLENVTLHAADLRDAPLGDAAFDVIVCHGVYSWVPDEVRPAILARIRRHLAADGVAFVSTNMMPGWRLRGTIREVFQRLVPQDGPSADRIAAARRVLDLWIAETEGRSDPAVVAMRAELLALRPLEDAYLRYEHLAAYNQPAWFGDLHAAFVAAGLQYVGDALPGTHRPPPPPEAPDDLAAIEELRDVITQRMFRRHLLIHRERPVDREVHWRRLRGTWLETPLRRDADGALVTMEGVAWPYTDPRAQALVRAVIDALPAAAAFDDVVPRSLPTAEQAALGACALELVRQGALVVRALRPPIARTLPARPNTIALARHQALGGAATNLRAERRVLPPAAASVLAACDGTRDHAALRDALRAAIAEGRGQILVHGAPSDAPDAVNVGFEAILDLLLHNAYFLEDPPSP